MSQINRNQESAENPNRRHSFYLINIIFLCCLTIASLLFALVVVFRLRTHGTDGIRQLYTKGQIETIEEMPPRMPAMISFWKFSLPWNPAEAPHRC